MMGDIKPEIRNEVLVKKQEVRKEELNLRLDEKTLQQLAPSKYEILKDKLNRLYVDLYVYKGQSFAEMELYELSKLKMIRLYINYVDEYSTSMINLPDVFIKDIIENVDVDLNLVIAIMKDIYAENRIIHKILDKIIDKYDEKKTGELIGKIRMNYDEFIKFVKLISEVMKEAYERG